MGQFIRLLHTLQGALDSMEGNFLVNDKGDFIVDHNDNFIEVVDDVPPEPPPPPPPYGDPHVSVIGTTDEDKHNYLPTYNYYCYSLTQQIYTASEINFSGYITGIVFYPRGTCNDRTLAVYITPTVNSAFTSSDSIVISSSDQVMSPTTVSITADEPMWLQFDNPYYYDGTNNLLITVHDTTGTYDSSIMFDTFNTSSVYQAMYQYTDSSPGYSPYVINSMTQISYKDSIQLLFNNAEPQGPVPPEDHYFMFTNRGNDTTVLFRTAATQSKVFINDEYVGKIAGGDTGASFSIPANAVIKVTGLKGFGNYNYSRGVVECTDVNANLSIDRFDESVAEYIDTDRVYMFGKNTGLKTITSWAGAENYTSLDRMFGYSDINTIITWEGLENVTTMYYAFANSELTTIPSTWAGLNNVTNMSTTFSASKLTAIPATWEGLENVTTMYYAFNGVTTLTTIPSSWKGLENVINMTQIFHGATNLASIPASWQYLSSVETLDYAFDNTAITMIPSTWAGLSHVTSMKYTFQNTGLTSIPASWAGLESVTDMLHTFCDTSITAIPSSWTGLENLVLMQYTFRNTPITALPSSWAPLSNVTQMTYTFGGCTSLTSIPSTWQGLSSATVMSYTFDGCSSLTNIPSTWVGLSSLTDMSYMFRNCSVLAAIPDSWNGLDNVTNMSYSFAHAGMITGGTTGFEHLSKLAKLQQAFRDCTNWTGGSLALCRYLRERNLAGYPSGWDFGYAFYNCTASDGYRYIPVDWGGLGEILYGTVEIGGKTYRTVQIYNQIWLADNLDYDFNGLTIDSTMGYSSYSLNERDVGPRACYLEDEATAKSKNHGLAYNWYALKYLDDNKATLLPEGWHVPTFDDFEILVKYSSTSSTFGTNAGKNLKSKTEWSTAGSNYDGFDDLPAGMYTMSDPPGPKNVGTSGSFWTLTVSTNSTGWYSYYLSIGSSNDASLRRDGTVGGTTQRKSVGFHVRLVKNLT